MEIDLTRTIHATTIVIPSQYWKEFQELVQRGLNLHPDASPTMKQFGDIVTSGVEMQPYHSMYKSKA